MKECTQCHLTKSSNEFRVIGKKKDGSDRLHSWCKSCRSKKNAGYKGKYTQEEYKKTKARNRKKRIAVNEYLQNNPCVDCGESDIRVLEFDHIDPKLKSYTISQLITASYSKELLWLEISKCRVLCANCHRRRTHKQRKWWV